jgi:hypothetical protein
MKSVSKKLIFQNKIDQIKIKTYEAILKELAF